MSSVIPVKACAFSAHMRVSANTDHQYFLFVHDEYLSCIQLNFFSFVTHTCARKVIGKYNYKKNVVLLNTCST